MLLLFNTQHIYESQGQKIEGNVLAATHFGWDLLCLPQPCKIKIK